MKTNSVMAEKYRGYMEPLGKTFRTRAEDEALAGGSTDMGNVSYIVPSIQPMFKIPTPVGNLHPDFTATTGTPAAHEAALITAQAMASVATELLGDAELLASAQAEFEAMGIDVPQAKEEMLGGLGVEGGVMGYWMEGDGAALNRGYAEWVEPVA